MARVKFEFSIEKITFKYEGDHETGQAISDSMQRTLGSLAEAQNAVIDVTPREEERMALPPVSAYVAPAKKRKMRRAKPLINGDLASGHSEVDPTGVKPARAKRSRSQGFRSLAYRLLQEGFFDRDRTLNDVTEKLTEMGYSLSAKNVSSELGTFTKLQYLTRRKNDENVWAFRQGPNNDYPRG